MVVPSTVFEAIVYFPNTRLADLLYSFNRSSPEERSNDCPDAALK